MPENVKIHFMNCVQVCDSEYQANPNVMSVRECVEYMDQWIDPLHQRLTAGFPEGPGLISKYVQDSTNRLARFQVISEPV